MDTTSRSPTTTRGSDPVVFLHGIPTNSFLWRNVIDPTEITAETSLLWGADDEFQPLEYAERLEGDIDDATVIGLDDANHWVMEDRPDAYREELASFLVE